MDKQLVSYVIEKIERQKYLFDVCIYSKGYYSKDITQFFQRPSKMEMKRKNLEKIKMSDKKIVTFDKAAPARIYTKSPSKLRSESPVDKMNPETIQNKESVKLEEEKQPNKFKELKRSRITALKAFNKNALKRRQIVRNKKNCVLIDVDPRVWKKNKSNCIPLIKYCGQENDEHLLHLSKYIRWLFKIGKYNSMSSESGSISSLSLFRKLNSRIGENTINISENLENMVDAELPEKIMADFRELYS